MSKPPLDSTIVAAAAGLNTEDCAVACGESRHGASPQSGGNSRGSGNSTSSKPRLRKSVIRMG